MADNTSTLNKNKPESQSASFLMAFKAGLSPFFNDELKPLKPIMKGLFLSIILTILFFTLEFAIVGLLHGFWLLHAPVYHSAQVVWLYRFAGFFWLVFPFVLLIRHILWIGNKKLKGFF
jgi:hypothetical protein